MTLIPGKRRFRLRVGASRAYTPTGWGWWYEVHDTAKPEGHRILWSGMRYSWHAALQDGADLRRAAEEKLASA